jgi:hydroxymethylbilane synthase
MERILKIGTRGSALALWQAQWVKTFLEKEFARCAFELVKIKTTGDKITDTALSKVGGKGLFVKEIEEALLDGRADLAVHSMKDVPGHLLSGLTLAAITERESPLDVLISRKGAGLKALPEGARIGTSSLRRQAQLLAVRPDVRIGTLRGNLDTRLRKLGAGEFDAIILAAAGVMRLGWEARITEILPARTLLPAVGQGALGIEVREDDERTTEMVSRLHHARTGTAVRAERAFLRRLEGGCQVPVAALGEIEGEKVVLEGLVASLDGRRMVRDRMSGPQEACEEIGVTLAEKLLAEGGRAILGEVYGREICVPEVYDNRKG